MVLFLDNCFEVQRGQVFKLLGVFALELQVSRGAFIFEERSVNEADLGETHGLQVVSDSMTYKNALTVVQCDVALDCLESWSSF
jgi:hypothetical protein